MTTGQATRLCLIGNSHLAALSLAWKEMSTGRDDCTLTFFGARATALAGLAARNGALRPNTPGLRKELEWTSGGSGKIVANDYDGFWLVGLGFGLETVLGVYRNYWAESHAPDAARIPVSDAFFARIVLARLRASLAVVLAKRLQTITDRPIAIVPLPNPSVAASHEDDPRFAPFRLAIARGDAAIVWMQYQAALTDISTEFGASILQQDITTRSDILFTDEIYSRGSVRLTKGMDKQHAQRDHFHMNPAYGATILRRHLVTDHALEDAA